MPIFLPFYMQCTKNSYDTKQIKTYTIFFREFDRSPSLFLQGGYVVIFFGEINFYGHIVNTIVRILLFCREIDYLLLAIIILAYLVELIYTVVIIIILLISNTIIKKFF